MRIILYSIILILFWLSIVSGCGFNFKKGNGNIDIYEQELDDFSRVYVGGNYEVLLIPSQTNNVIIETDENLFRYINIENFDNTLNINNVHRLKSTEGIFIKIMYKHIERIHSTGASKIAHEGILETNDLKIDLSGAGSIELDIETQQVKIQMSGAGIIKLAGSTRLQEADISGAGGLLAQDLRSEECEVNLSGLGGANIYATEKLDASITGIGGITYSGNPKLIEKHITGLGKIKRNEEYYDQEYVEENPL